MSRATALAHPNIALVKYWGKRDEALNLPAVPSLSLTLGGFTTRTSVTWGAPDAVVLNGAPATPAEAAKVRRVLDLIDRAPCRVESENDFPTGAGLASSASGFAALAVAAAAAAGLEPSREALSVLARRGSGSACRSLWGGFVEWRLGERADGADSHGLPVADWDVRMVVAVTASGRKAVGSTEGMRRALTSPLWRTWVDGAPADVEAARRAVLARDLAALGAVTESSTMKMHATMLTSAPPLLYWNPATVACLHAVYALRERGVGAWATMDAGPNVKVLCAPADADAVAEALRPHAERALVLGPGEGARLG